MILNAIGVSSINMAQTVSFYKLLGFEFGEFETSEQHIEAASPKGGAKLMIDSHELVESLIGEAPRPGNHSAFAVQYDSPTEVNEVAKKVSNAGFIVDKQPWDAFWGQRYCVVEDPDGYKIDLYAQL